MKNGSVKLQIADIGSVPKIALILTILTEIWYIGRGNYFRRKVNGLNQAEN